MQYVAVVGSRDFPAEGYVRKFLGQRLAQLAIDGPFTVISGGARGVDTWAEQVARSMGFEFREFPADWAKYGRKAGAVRNAQLVDWADYLIAFWDGHSRGTKNALDHCRAMRVDYEVHWPQ